MRKILLGVCVVLGALGCVEARPSPFEARPKAAARSAPIPAACMAKDETTDFYGCCINAGVSDDDASAAIAPWQQAMYERRRKASEKAAAAGREKAKLEAAEREAAEQARRDEASRADAIHDWKKRYYSTCKAELSSRICEAAPTGAGFEAIDACRSTCKDAVLEGFGMRSSKALDACLDRYVAAAGKGAFACALELPATSEIPAEAVEKRTKACSAECVKQGPQVLADARESDRAETQGYELVMAYKRCMVAADSTPTARKYSAYDRSLYLDLIYKANASCRAASRCDWVEKFSRSYQCRYAPD